MPDKTPYVLRVVQVPVLPDLVRAGRIAAAADDEAKAMLTAEARQRLASREAEFERRLLFGGPDAFGQP